MTGKQKCKILKQIRKQIADANEIALVVEECRHQGNCKGTCPRCEWEVRELEKALEKRRLTGKKVALAGISAGFLLTACTPVDFIRDQIHEAVDPLEGVPMVVGETEIIEQQGELLAPESESHTVVLGEAPVAETEGKEPDTEVMIAGMMPAPEESEEIYELEGDVAFFESDFVESEETP